METAAGKRGRPKKKKGRPTTRDTVVDQKLPKHQKKKVYHHQYYEDCKEENTGSLYFESGKFWVKDKGSSNGTFLNNERLGKMERKLEHGDILRLGTIGPDTKCVIALVHLCYPSTEKTLSMDSLIDQLEREENLTPYMQAQLKGLKEAKEDRDLLKVTTKEALALNPSLFDFPESQEM